MAFADSSGSALSQTTSALLTAGYTYTLQVSVGHRLPFSWGEPWPFPGYQVQLLAGDDVLEKLNTPVTPAQGKFEVVTLTYTATTSSPGLNQLLGIRLISNGSQTNFDKVSLDYNPVPVPGTLVLLASGLLPLIGWRRYRG